MFRKMRRNDRQLSEEETITILDKVEYGVLSSIGTNRYPYGIPINHVYHNGHIYFHCATSGVKLENINQNGNVSFCAVSEAQLVPEGFTMKFKSVVVFGKAMEVFNLEKQDGLTALVRRFSSEYTEAGMQLIGTSLDKVRVFKIEIECVTGKGK